MVFNGKPDDLRLNDLKDHFEGKERKRAHNFKAVTDEMILRVAQLRARGYQQQSIATALGMSLSTFKNKMNENELLRSAYEVGTGCISMQIDELQFQVMSTSDKDAIRLAASSKIQQKLERADNINKNRQANVEEQEAFISESQRQEELEKIEAELKELDDE